MRTIGRLAPVFLAVALTTSCFTERPCYWSGLQDRDTAALSTPAASLTCDGKAETPPPTISVRYWANSSSLSVEIAAGSITVSLFLEPSLPDGTYTVVPWPETSAEARQPLPPATLRSSGSKATGTFRFARSRNVPFVDIAEPPEMNFTSTIELEFDLVATLPTPQGDSGCELVTGKQSASIEVSGPVVWCAPSFGGH